MSLAQKAFSQQIVNEIASYKKVFAEFSKSIANICSPMYTFQTDVENSYLSQLVKESINISSSFVSEMKRRRKSIKALIESDKAKRDNYWKIVKSRFVEIFEAFEAENSLLETQFNFYVNEFRSIMEKVSPPPVSDEDSEGEEIFYDLFPEIN